MINKKILIIASYPIDNPQHGGQKRAKAIFEYYKSIFSKVKFVAVFYQKSHDSRGPEDLTVEDPAIIAKIEENFFLVDVITGEAIYQDLKVRQKLIKLIQNYQPDFIQMEQVYVYAGIKQLLPELSANPQLILSSHNIESRMKEEIYQGIDMPDKERRSLVNKIRGLEIEISQKALVVIAVSKADAEEHKRMGAKKCIVAPNGIEEIVPTNAAVNHWRKFKKEQSIKRFVAFVGSAHPPNLAGFQKMIGEDIGFLPKDTKLMLAGGISQYLQGIYNAHGTLSDEFWRRAAPLGHLSDDNLAGLLAESEVILLPIISGGGSNLKTAEAILSGKKIVATPYAFRSYEKYKDLPNIRLANSQKTFTRQILNSLQSPYLGRSVKQVKLAERVQWRYCLRPLKKYLPIIIGGRFRAVIWFIKNKAARILLVR